MNIILISGFLAAGKTIFSKKLSQKLKILTINKDYVKEILCDTIGFANREENLKMSAATFEIMAHIAEKSMEAKLPIILESNFRQSEGEKLMALIKKFGYTPITIMMTGDLQVLFKRFTARLEGRHPAHLSGSFFDYERYCEYCENLLAFDVGGERISIDATDIKKIDFNSIAEQVRGLL